jgi:3-oxoacyl-[acyl-carrier-protein] synthase III
MMSARIGLTHTAYYLPERVDDVRSWARRAGHSAACVAQLERVGVRYYRDAAGESVASMAMKAIDALIRSSGLSPNTLDCMIYTHTLQGSVAPPPMSLTRIVCDTFGFVHAEAFSFAQQHCASLLGALRVIRAMFVARPALRRVLLVGADAMPVASERLIEGAGLMSDGACAALIERDSPVNRLIAVRTHASGLAWQGALGQQESHLATQYFLSARQLIATVASDAGLEPTAIQRILPHHLDLPAWHRVLSSLGIARERLFTENFSRIAHVSVSDPIINLTDCHSLLWNEPLLLFAHGVGGFSSAALLLR